jgi:predicted secreted protein
VIGNNNGKEKKEYLLDAPSKVLIMEPEDWHIMKEFTPNAILMVLASEYFDKNDYIFETYP